MVHHKLQSDASCVPGLWNLAAIMQGVARRSSLVAGRQLHLTWLQELWTESTLVQIVLLASTSVDNEFVGSRVTLVTY